MKTLYIMLIIGIGISMIITVILFLQNSSLRQQIDSLNNVMNSDSILNEYEKQFGNITLGYDPPHVSLDGKIYVIEGIASVNTNVESNSTYAIKTNHNYLIQAHFTRKYDIKPSLIYYVCHLQILNSTNHLVMSEWGDIVLIPKQNSSNCALQWIPTKVGNYTAQAFATEDEMGSASLLSSPAAIHIHVSS